MNPIMKTISNIVLKDRRESADFTLEKTLACEIKKDHNGLNTNICFYCKQPVANKYCGVCMKYYCEKCSHKICRTNN